MPCPPHGSSRSQTSAAASPLVHTSSGRDTSPTKTERSWRSVTIFVFIYDVRTLRTQLTDLYCQVVLGNIMNCTTLHFITGQPTHTVLVDRSINTPTGQPTCSNAYALVYQSSAVCLCFV